VTGGAGLGIHEQHFAYGSMRLATDSGEIASGGSSSAPVPHAEFVDVASWLVRDSQSPYQWTDQRLNLSGLFGTFSTSDPNRLTFQGVDGQGQPFTLTALQRGRLLHLVGENSPSCCGFFKYTFDALAFESPYADFNLDGIVNGSDASLLMANMGTFANAIFEQGDADGDGDVDGSDFLTWQREIGDAVAMSEFADVSFGSFAAGSAAVPEPFAVLLMGMGVAMLPVFVGRWCR
jgi:hypothetical protein